MKSKILTYVVLVASGIAVCIGGQSFVGTTLAQAAQKRTGSARTFQLADSWPKVPGKWKLGHVVAVAIDAQDNVWILHRPKTLPEDQVGMAAPSVLQFDSAGNFIQAWGGPGEGYEWPEREHGIHVDYKGNVWVGGNYCPARKLPGFGPHYDDQLLKFTKNGKFLLQIGRRDQSTGNADTKNLHEPAKAFVYQKTNEVFVADGYGNHRVIVFDADTGAFKRMWGAFGNKPLDADFCPNVASGNSRPLPVNDGGPGPQQFGIVHSIGVSNDGLVYVADRYQRIQVFTPEGKYITQLLAKTVQDSLGSTKLTQSYYRNRGGGFATSLSKSADPKVTDEQLLSEGYGFGTGLTFSSDPKQEFLYVSGRFRNVMINRKTLEVVDSFGTEGDRGGGHDIAADSKGNIYSVYSQRPIHKWSKGM